MVKPARLVLVVLIVLLVIPLVRLPVPIARPLASVSAQPFGPPTHRNYWLHGRTLDWNGTNPSPSLNASDGDTISIILQSDDHPNVHNWYLDLNGNGTVESNEIPTRSIDFNCATYCLNFTIILFLGQGNYTSGGTTHVGLPHGGLFSYRCQYHPLMHGDFIFNAGPVASFTHSPQTPLVGHVATFDGSSSWPTTGKTIRDFSWNFGDGNATSSGSNPVIAHSYATNGTFTVTLTVSDTASETVQATQNVTVKNPPPIPFDYQITASPANASVLAGQSLAVTLTLTLVSGVPENVSLTRLISPSPSNITASFNVTSGLPAFHSRLTIQTNPSTVVTVVVYNITIIAISTTGVAHNFTLRVAVGPLPPPCNCPALFLLPILIGAGALSVIVAVLVLRQRRKSKLPNLPASEA